jgi:hypothetical protein
VVLLLERAGIRFRIGDHRIQTNQAGPSQSISMLACVTLTHRTETDRHAGQSPGYGGV